MTEKQFDPQITSGAHTSYWIGSLSDKAAAGLSFPPLDKDMHTDVVIVGGGISGITIAFCLLCTGKKVVVVEDGNIGSGETGRTTAHLVTALDDRYYSLEQMYGEEETKLAAASHKAAIDFIERTVSEENISCRFTRLSGYLFRHPTDEEDALEKELAAAFHAGIKIKYQQNVPGLKINQPCLEFSDQGQFSPLEYLHGLCASVVNRGGQIFTGTHAKEISTKGVVTDQGYTVTADHIVVATNSPVNNKYATHLKQYPHRSYVIAGKIKKGSLPKALWWDTGDHGMNSSIPPYHYIRIDDLDEEHDILIAGGEDHPTGLPDDIPEEERYAKLEQWTRAHFDMGEILYRWSGQVMEPMDSLAYIGRNPMDKDNIYIVTGDSGNGMTHGTIAGMLITDLINGKENPWEKIYDPSRFKLKAGGTFVKELIGGMADYIKNKPGETKPDELLNMKAGEGMVITISGKKYGVYKDHNGELHTVSAECTHLGCIVNWNNEEKTWDCPCHGSRFTHEGKVVNGPANSPLHYHKGLEGLAQ